LLFGFSLTALPGCGGGSDGGSGDASGGSGVKDVSVVQSTDCDGGSDGREHDGSVNVTWTAPEKHTDGKPIQMSDIGGYVLYCGPSKQDLAKNKIIQSRTQTSYSMKDVPPGTYYVAVSAKDNAGREGPKSKVISTTVR
jgi:hypothetical protein